MDPDDEHDAPARPATPEVLDALVAGHREFLAFLERRLGDRAAAEDLLQEAFVKGLTRGGELRSAESAVAWFYRLLRNALVDRARRDAAARRRLEAVARELGDGAEPGPEARAAVCACVARLAGTLKPEYAAALQRIEVDGASLKDFAAEAGITPGNAGVRVHRAREALRRRVQQSCGTCAEHGSVDCSCGSAGPGATPFPR